MATLQAENARLIEEERRKTIAEETKHARAVLIITITVYRTNRAFLTSL